jgi:hypothetical protein
VAGLHDSSLAPFGDALKVRHLWPDAADDPDFMTFAV